MAGNRARDLVLSSNVPYPMSHSKQFFSQCRRDKEGIFSLTSYLHKWGENVRSYLSLVIYLAVTL